MLTISLVVIYLKYNKGDYMSKVKCDCGNTAIVLGDCGMSSGELLISCDTCGTYASDNAVPA